MDNQKLTLTGVKGLEINLYNCENCTINGFPLEELLAARESVQKEVEKKPSAAKLSKRRTSEILDQTDLVLDDVNTLDDVAMNISQAVHETIQSSGDTGLQQLYDSAEDLKRILNQADKRVANLSDYIHNFLEQQLSGDEREEAAEGGSVDAKSQRSFGSASKGKGSSGSKKKTTIDLHKRQNPLEGIFPKKIVEALSCDVGDDVAEQHASVTVLMSDIVGFTAWCSEVSPTKVIECLSAYFQVIDDLAETFGVYKVETVGDGYQAICGAPVFRKDHADTMAVFALKVIETLPTMRIIFNSEDFDVRVGINSGPIVTGVIRADRIRWQLFGDTVNVASRMESTSVPGRIQISKSTRDLLLFSDNFNVEKRGLIEVKGKGQQETFFLNGAKTNELFKTKSTRKSFSLLSEFIDVADGGLGKRRESESSGVEDNVERDASGPNSPRKDKTGAGEESGLTRVEESKPEVTTVLLVDDLLSILLQYTRILQREGIHVVTAKNGLEGLEQLKRGKFTCCFCDIHMPKMDGMEMIKAYRKWESAENKENKLPVFALTGNTDLVKNTNSFLNAGFDEVVSKTNYKEVLLSYVQSCIANS